MASARPRGHAAHSTPHDSPPAPSINDAPRPVRRNLFQGHLSRRPPSTRSGDPVRASPSLSRTTSTTVSTGTGTSASTLVLGSGRELDLCSDIVIRGSNGEFDVGDPVGMLLEGRGEEVADEDDEEARARDKERQRLADAVKHHLRDRNRAPSEPAELLDAVRAVLRAKVTQLSEDEWMYEAESEDVGLR